MNLSIIIPLLNEEESLDELFQWINESLQPHGLTYEVIFIDDGSEDDSWGKIQELSYAPNVTGIRFNRNYGKSQALHAGFNIAKGEVVITMDADLQDNPTEIPELYSMVKNENYDLVSGWKKKRYDSVVRKNIPSKLFNLVARKTSGLKLHDFNCGLKVYKNEVVKNIYVYGEMHRYIPVLAKNAGFSNIGEKVVQHQSRKFGKTKFGHDRFIKGFLDLLSLWFLSRFGKRPMHFFGAGGVLMFIIGFLLALWIGGSKLYKLWNGIPDIRVTMNAWFYIALITMVIGTQLFVAGFIGELILRKKDGKQYKIKETLNLE